MSRWRARAIRFAVLALVGGGGVFLYGAWQNRSVTVARENAERQSRANAQEIPADERAAWFSSLDRALIKVSVHSGYVRFDSELEGMIFEPLSSAKIGCDPIFGVRIGDMILVSHRGLLGFETMPPLSVGNQSPAAVNLMRDLCHRVIETLKTRTLEAKNQ